MSASATVTVTQMPITVTLTANPTTVMSGTQSTLTWGSTGTTSCSAPWTNLQTTTGSAPVTPTATTTYTITCTGSGGSMSASATVTVTPIAPPPPTQICGNNICDASNNETCSTCPGDCGVCPPPPAPQQATLTLKKIVNNVNGGNATTNEWTLSAAGPVNISGISSSADVTNKLVPIGTYTLSEIAVNPAGQTNANYTTGSWTCTGTTISGATITLSSNQNVTCSITNTYAPQMAHLVLQKQFNGIGNGSNWTLSARSSTTNTFINGRSGTSDASGDLSPGTYTLSEVGDPISTDGYRQDGLGWKCGDSGSNNYQYIGGNSIPLSGGENKICTIINIPPATIDFLKNTIDGQPQSFTYNIDGPGVSNSSPTINFDPGIYSGSTRITAQPGSGLVRYKIIEVPQPGWKINSATCTVNGGPSNGGSVVSADPNDPMGTMFVDIRSGDKVVCSFINAFLGANNKAKLTIIKRIVDTATPVRNDITSTLADGTYPFDFTATDQNNRTTNIKVNVIVNRQRVLGRIEVLQSTTIDIDPGTYTIAERLAEPEQFSEWGFKNAHCQSQTPDGRNNNGGTPDLNNRRVTGLVLTLGGIASCEFENTKKDASLTIVKASTPDKATFNFSVYQVDNNNRVLPPAYNEGITTENRIAVTINRNAARQDTFYTGHTTVYLKSGDKYKIAEYSPNGWAVVRSWCGKNVDYEGHFVEILQGNYNLGTYYSGNNAGYLVIRRDDKLTCLFYNFCSIAGTCGGAAPKPKLSGPVPDGPSSAPAPAFAPITAPAPALAPTSAPTSAPAPSPIPGPGPLPGPQPPKPKSSPNLFCLIFPWLCSPPPQ